MRFGIILASLVFAVPAFADTTIKNLDQHLLDPTGKEFVQCEVAVKPGDDCPKAAQVPILLRQVMVASVMAEDPTEHSRPSASVIGGRFLLAQKISSAKDDIDLNPAELKTIETGMPFTQMSEAVIGSALSVLDPAAMQEIK